MDSRTSAVLQETNTKPSSLSNKELIVESKRTESDITLNDEKNSSLMKTLKAHYQSYGVLKSLLSSHTKSITDINLSVIETRQEKKENPENKKSESKETTFHNSALTEYEREYNVTETIDVKDIFNAKNKKKESQSGEQKPIKRLLILGRAGIGKSTMSQYFAYEWSQGKLWQNQFDYVFLIPLRNLTQPYYRKQESLSIASIIQSECIKSQEKEIYSDIEKLLNNKSKRLLFILDGYDEVAELLNQDTIVSRVLKTLLAQERVILTSRPYHLQDTHLFDRQLENMGFTDQNIEHYVKRYFTSLKDEKQSETCLNFLKNHPSLWGSAHVPINLALITETWQQAQEEKSIDKQLNNQEEKAKNSMTDIGLTQLYHDIIHYLIKRHLEKQNKGQTRSRSPAWLYQQVNLEMAYLEQIAFDGLKASSVNLEPKLQREVQETIEKECKEKKEQSLFDRVLQLGFLRTIGADESEEINKAHYFIHLTFQEFFAARYLINGLKQPTGSKRHQAALQFLCEEKYNRRYQIVLGFMAGLLSTEPECMVQQEEKQDKSKKAGKKITTLHLFWNTLLSPPLDIYGAGHLGLILRCLEEAQCDPRIPMRTIMLSDIRQWFKAIIPNQREFTNQNNWLINLLSVFPRILHVSECLEIALRSLRDKEYYVRANAARVLGDLGERAASEKVVTALLQALKDQEGGVQSNAAMSLGKLGEKAASEKVVAALIEALRDYEDDPWISLSAAGKALERLNEKIGTEKVVDALLQALRDKDKQVRAGAVEVLRELREKAASEKVVTALLQALGDKEEWVRRKAAQALGNLGEKAASETVVAALLEALRGESQRMRGYAAEALGNLGEKAASEKVVAALLQALKNNENWVRRDVVEALGNLGEKAASEKVVAALVEALADNYDRVREKAAEALGKLGEKIVSEKVVATLLQGLGSKDKDIRARAAEALGNLGDKAASEKVVDALLQTLKDGEWSIREKAVNALGQLGEKVVSEKVVAALLKALEDQEENVRVEAADALGNLGQKAASEKVVAALLEALGGVDEEVRAGAARALGKLGEQFASKKIVTALLQVLEGRVGDMLIPRMARTKHRGAGIKESAAAALGSLGQKVASEKVVVALLKAAVKREDYDEYEVSLKAEEVLGGLCSVTQLIQLYPKLARRMSEYQFKSYREFLRKRAFESAVTITFIDSCVVIWESQKQTILKNLSEDQVQKLVEGLTVTADNDHLPIPHLSYGLSLDISINKNQNSNPVFIGELYGKQAVKIQLNYTHDACKKAPFDVLSTVLKTLDHEHLHYLDLSDNRLTDEVAATLAVRYIAKGKWSNLRTLKLSDNQLSLKGLCYLLQELSANSSFKFLDVDQNRIAYEAKEFQEKLEPFIKKAQLERLDLSLNFIDKGELVQSNGRRLVLDKQIIKQKIEEEKRVCIKSFLSNSFIVQSKIGVIKSLLDPDLELSRSHGVIALMANKTSSALSTKEHAFMALEYMHHFGQRTIIVGELFYNKDTKKIIINLHYQTPQYFLERTQGYGDVSSVSQKNKAEQKQTDKNNTNEKVYKRTGLFEKNTIKQVIKEMIKSSNEKGFYDYGVVFVNGANELNCIKWALKMLNKGAGIPTPDKWQVPSWMVNPESSRCLVM